MTNGLPDGLYEQVINRLIEDRLSGMSESGRSAERRKLDAADSADVLARYVAGEIARALHGLPADHRTEHQLALCNEILSLVRQRFPGAAPPELDLHSPAEQLLAIYSEGDELKRPTTPLAISELLTGAQGEPRLGLELQAELASADAADVLVSFIKWRGLLRLKQSFEQMARAGRRVRVLSTTYMGASDAEAMNWLARLPGVEVRVSFDHRRTRLHAKAWMFHRLSGFSTVYVGSANVSASALDTGLEWTLKACQPDAPHIIEKYRGAFDSLWEDGEFEPYNPDDEVARERLIASLAEGRGGRELSSQLPAYFTLQPYPFQQEILDELEIERAERGRFHNLVVAATGTGKTMLAAFDYARQIGRDGLKPRLLFVAHREELLKQALTSFRHVLHDHSFGELLGGGYEPRSHDHLFATIQSLRSRNLLAQHGGEHWDYVVIDEFHHAAAASYTELLNGLNPRILLGLTATPERTDGLDVLHWFEGRTAAEIRLWDALDRQLLTPFDYYGIHDGIDLSKVRWQRGGYDLGELDRIYTGHDLRAALVIRQFQEHYGQVSEARALGFCVSVAHAEYMARRFNDAGIPAIAVHGSSDSQQRASAISRLRAREVNAIFTCDLYNEGVDIPEADCLLMLRPTESPTVFLQQLGRGLRPSTGKATTLVLDFVGHAHRRFRFDMKLLAMTGTSRGRLIQAVEDGFPLLPAGCHMQLDRVASQIVLENIRQAVQASRVRLAEELRSIAREHVEGVSLATYLKESGYELEDIYRRADSWTALKRLAGLLPAQAAPGEEQLCKRFGRMLYIDEAPRLRLYLEALANPPDVSKLAEADRRRLMMLSFRVHARPFMNVSEESGIKAIAASQAASDEFRQLCELLLERSSSGRAFAPGAPIALHRSYAREEDVLTAFGRWTAEAQPPLREGRIWIEGIRTELMFVTLNKSEKKFSPTTRYHDYAISDSLFHWQSQSTTSEDSPSGRRYRGLEGDAQFILFVRENQKQAYVCAGPAKYLKHEGSRPMSIVWRLDTPLPARLFKRYATLKSA